MDAAAAAATAAAATAAAATTAAANKALDAANVVAKRAKRHLDEYMAKHRQNIKRLRASSVLADAELRRTAADLRESSIREKYLEFDLENDPETGKATKTAEAAAEALPAPILRKIYGAYVRNVCPTVANEYRALATFVARSRSSSGRDAVMVMTWGPQIPAARPIEGFEDFFVVLYNSGKKIDTWESPEGVLWFPGTRQVTTASVEIFLGRQHTVRRFDDMDVDPAWIQLHDMVDDFMKSPLFAM